MEREADLKDYLQLFWKYRMLIISLPAVCVGLLLVLFLLGVRVYRADMFFNVGKVMAISSASQEVNLIENPAAVVERLKGVYRLKNVYALLPSPIIFIKLNHISKGKLITYVDKVKKLLLTQHQEEYNKYMQYYNSHLQDLEERISALKTEIKALEQNRGENSRLAMLELTTNGRSVLLERKDYLSRLQSELGFYKNIIIGKVIYPSSFINEPFKFRLDYKWHAVLLIMGFSLGLLAAAVMAFYQEMRKRL